MPPAFHAITVSLLTGMFFFAMIAAVVRLAITWRKGDPTSKVAIAADLSSLWSATIGWVVVFGALVTGFSVWSLSAVTNSPVMRNKILAAVLLLVAFAIYIGLRFRVGPSLWQSKVMSVFAVFVAGAGFHWAMVANSIGGDIAGIPSGYENIVRLSGVETRFTYYLPDWLIITMVIASVVMLVLAFLPQRTKTEVAAK